MPTKTDAHIANAAKYLGGVSEDKLIINPLTFNFIHISVIKNFPRYSYNSARWCAKSPVFQNATSILFFVSCIAYDEFTEDGPCGTNCLVDSCNLFGRIVNLVIHFFAHMSVILFFTKADLLEEKIKHSNIKEYFPEFQGDPRKLEDVQSFIFQMFDDRREGKPKALYHYFTAADDTEHIRFVFAAVKDTILENNLKSLKCY